MTPTMRNRLSAACLVVALAALAFYLYLSVPKEKLHEHLAALASAFGPDA